MKIKIRKNGNFRLFFLADVPMGVDPKIAWAKINKIHELLNGPEVMLLRGQGPTWMYGMFSHAAHASGTFATYYPQKDSYVVIHSHSGQYKPGDLISSSTVGMTVDKEKIIGGEKYFDNSKRLVIAVGGPPHSGKSVF